MKKILAVVLSLALVFSSFTFAFADTTVSADAQACIKLAMLKGDSAAGVDAAYLAKPSTRLQAAIMFLRLKGLEQAALEFKGSDNFADAKDVKWDGGKAVMAYMKAHPELGWGGVGNNNFAPNREISAAEYYKVMLESLGYKQTVDATVVGDFTFANVITFAAEKGLTKAAAATKFTNNDIATATVEALKANVKGGTKTLAVALVEAKAITLEAATAAGVMPTAVALAVDSITAKTAKSFVVKFNTAVADTAKIATTVTRASINVTLTPAWNTEKTELTLSSSSKLVEDTYKLVVKNDAVEMKTAELKIEQEKVAKIEFLSDVLVRANDWEGSVPVKVTNQYGEDITNAPLASGISFTGGDSAALIKNTNKVKVVKGTVNTYALTDLRYMTMVVITAFDSNSATFASKTLKVSDTVGGIAEITFKGLVDKAGKEVTLSQSTTDKVFLAYEAKDAFGNIVDDYDTLKNTNVVNFFSSNTSVATLSVERNAANNTKADLVITVPNSTSTWVIDMPVIFTAVAYTGGKSATFSTTVARKAAVGTFLVTAPTTQVARGETAVIPYTAYDQAGKELKSFNDLNNAATINVSGGNATVIQERAANGDYMLKITFADKAKYFVSTVVPTTGKMSQFTVDVRDAAKPASLASVDSLFYPYYLPGASQTKDFIKYYGGLNGLVKDQYDREFNMQYQTKYALIATSDNANIITVTTTDGFVNQGDTLKAIASGDSVYGTATITIKLVDTTYAANDARYVIDERSTRITKIKVSDVAKYEWSPIADMYATSHSTYSKDTAARAGWEASTLVFGRTSGGAKVRIPASMVVSRTTSDSRFAFNGGYIYAKDLGSNVAEATAKAFATVLADGVMHTATTDMKAFSSQPVAEDIYISTYGVFNHEVEFNSSLNTYTMNKTKFDAMNGTSIYQFRADGSALDPDSDVVEAGDITAYAYFYLEVSDNHGGWGLLPSYTTITKLSGTGTAKFTVDKNGVVTRTEGATASGDQYQLQSVSTNGLVCTYKIVIQ